ncbi:TNF receptor-associated factor 4-like isoform X2 [Macrosteles quadrilineatus]|uniref:TNF receptor-associated factor 4-like isoform X2 n=1 Tax=Macrosteles quadrilineatus TaxID=74068 RepID=UPI0023E2095C|nr:TNF receptor-associated factor 4-like isoform X2 [Macrosteles quadrilineatus]
MYRVRPRDVSSSSIKISDSEKDIMSSMVYCIHHKEGCKWNDQLRKLKAHLNTCKHDAIPCTNACGAQIPRVLMEDHLKFTCSERLARCEFCGTDLPGAALDKHTGTCPLEPLYCENKCGMKLQRRLLGRHKQSECNKRLVACRYCTQSYVADTLQTHHSACLRAPVPCPNRCEMGIIPREDLDSHLKDQCASLLTPCTFKEAGCRFKGLRGMVMERHLEENSQQHLALMCSLVTRQQHQITSLKSALSRLSLNHTGTLVWKVTEFSAKMAEARCKEGMELVSPPFYTSQFGYKLQASLFLNGNGAGENTHLSLYIKLLPGEYDALLRWPFAHSVAFTLFDQSEKACNIVESFVPDPTWENFQRPSKASEPDTLGFGFPRFVSHESLGKRNFTRDDTLYIRIKVDPSKIVAV